MKYNYITTGILGLGLIGTTVLNVNQYQKLQQNQQQINHLSSEMKINKNNIDELVNLNTDYKKSITNYKEKVDKLQINIKNKDKENDKLNKELHDIKLKLHKGDRGKSLRQVKKVIKTSTSNSNQSFNITVTAYTSMCSEGCSGVTATGIDVRNTTTYNGMRIIATDPSVIPLYSTVRIDLNNGQSFNAIALDTGGGIKGLIVDYLVSSENEAVQFGRQQAKVTVLRK